MEAPQEGNTNLAHRGIAEGLLWQSAELSFLVMSIVTTTIEMRGLTVTCHLQNTPYLCSLHINAEPYPQQANPNCKSCVQYPVINVAKTPL